VYINNRCRYQSITQQYLKRCLIKDDSNYMFRPIAAIISFSSESMVVVPIGLVWLYHDGEISTSVMFAIVKGHGGGICDVRYPGVYTPSVYARCCPM
jgi:hypothetical protein